MGEQQVGFAGAGGDAAAVDLQPEPRRFSGGGDAMLGDRLAADEGVGLERAGRKGRKVVL